MFQNPQRIQSNGSRGLATESGSRRDLPTDSCSSRRSRGMQDSHQSFGNSIRRSGWLPCYYAVDLHARPWPCINPAGLANAWAAQGVVPFAVKVSKHLRNPQDRTRDIGSSCGCLGLSQEDAQCGSAEPQIRQAGQPPVAAPRDATLTRAATYPELLASGPWHRQGSMRLAYPASTRISVFDPFRPDACRLLL